jgi:hypothetical protein
MRRKATLVVLGLVIGSFGLALGSCGFSQEQFLGDAAPPPVTVGFAQDSQLQDESSGAIQVIVRLSRPAPEPIAVSYAIGGGTAVIDQDFTAVDQGTLSFDTGISEMAIDLVIAIDTIEEDDETIEITLSNPTGGAQLGTSRHTITINHALLPRVNFSVEVSDSAEANSLDLTLTLDQAPLLESTATIAVKMTSTASPTHDFSMPTNATVTFPVNSQSQTITVPINNDSVDEDPETVVVEIATTTNVVIGTKKERAHTINDDDNPPSVQFMVASSNATEGSSLSNSVTANVVVTLSGPSGKVVTVPVQFAGGTATETDDYGYNAKTSLVFMPNQDPSLSEVTKTIVVTIVGDSIDEENQTVITSLVETPTNASIGTPAMNTLTINDDDMAPTIAFTTDNQTVGEQDTGTTTTTYNMELSAASERSISYTITFTGAATIPMDFTTVPTQNADNTTTTITIAPGMTTASIGLVVVGDTVSEGMTDETIVMTIGNPLSNVRAVGGNALLQRVHTIDDFDP